MLNPFLKKLTLSKDGICSVHSSSPYTHMCLADNCSERLLCEQCCGEHQSGHSAAIFNTKDYLETLFRSSRDKNNDDLFAQIQCFISTKEETMNAISELQDDRERDVLGIFDELKSEINGALDIAYQKYCNSLRTYHQSRLHDIQKKFNIIQNMLKVQTCVQERSFPTLSSDSDLLDLVKLFAKYRNQTITLSNDLADKFKMLSGLVKDNDHFTLNLDHKLCDDIRNNIIDLIKEQFKISEEYDRNVSISIDSSTSDWSREKTSYDGHAGEICSLVALKDDLVATAGRDARIKLWNLRSGECAGELGGHQDTIWDLQSAFDGKYLISSSSDTTIKVWRINERKCKKTFKGHSSAVYALEFIESGKTLVSGAQDGALIYWDMNEGKIQKRLAGHEKAIWSIKKLNSATILTASEDMSIKMWSLRTSEVLNSFKGHASCVFDISVFNNGKNFASCSDDGVILLWDTERGTVIDSLQAHKNGIKSISVNSTGTLLASGGYDRTLRVWDLQKMCLIKENESNDSAIRSIAFLNSSSLLYCDTNVKNYKFTKY